MPDISSQRCAIVGGGISGLSAANLLKKHQSVVVFEREKKPGGLIRCERVNGSLFHICGGHVFNTKNQTVKDWFWSRFDCDRDFIKADRHSAVCLEDGSFVDYPIENHVYQLPEDIQRGFYADVDEMLKHPDRTPSNFDGWKINVRGRVVGRCGRYTGREPLGAAMAMTRDCFVGFGSVAYPRAVDDIVFGLRALMRGGRELTLADKLLYYRVGCGISSAQYVRRESQKRCIKASIAAYDELLHELACGCAWLSDQEKIQWRDNVECTRVGCARWLDLVAGETFVARFSGWKACGNHGASIWARCYQAVYILPCWLSDLILLPINIVKCVRDIWRVWRVGNKITGVD